MALKDYRDIEALRYDLGGIGPGVHISGNEKYEPPHTKRAIGPFLPDDHRRLERRTPTYHTSHREGGCSFSQLLVAVVALSGKPSLASGCFEQACVLVLFTFSDCKASTLRRAALLLSFTINSR